MVKRKIWLSEDISDFLGNNLNIVLPEEFLESSNLDHYEAEVTRTSLQYNAIIKGVEFSEEDFEKISVKLTMQRRYDEAIQIGNIWKRQQRLPRLLFDMYYDKRRKFKPLVDTNNIDGIIAYLDNAYVRQFGKIPKSILHRDALSIIKELRIDRKRTQVIDDLLNDNF